MADESLKLGGANQVGKFMFSGLATNASAYVVYMLLTASGMGHKTAMTLVFLGGMAMSYSMNKNWTFAFHGPHSQTFWRFSAAYAVAYVLNYSSMWLLVDRLGIPHYWVQAANLVVISALLFVAQKFWIFAAPSGKLENGGAGSR